MYIWSLLFDHSSTAIAYSSLANTLLAMGTFVAVIVMRQIERSEPEVILEERQSWLMGNIFTIFPQDGFRNYSGRPMEKSMKPTKVQFCFRNV